MKKQLWLSKEPNPKFKWNVVRDHVAENPPSEYTHHGIAGFDPLLYNYTKVKSPDYQFPYGRSIEQLWPGVWRNQMENMNVKIEKDNSKLANHIRRIMMCTEDEWWKIWGIIILAAKLGFGGISKLYDKDAKLIEYLEGIDLSKVMPKYRAQQLIKYLPYAFHGDDPTDPWNPIISLIDGFNSNRARKVAASYCKVLDETMSAWSPTTTKYGGLPFLSFILRKPTPLGTEFKSVACTVTSEFN